MTMLFEIETVIHDSEPFRELAEQVIEEALDQMECPFETTVSLTLTDSEAIREMNLDFRGIDSPTDVLSFPMLSFEKEGDFGFLETLEDNELAAFFDPDSGELVLGDIVINMDFVYSQAEMYGHSVRREFAFLVAHSMLHLMGFDHMEDAEADRMEEKQENILAQLQIFRD